MSTDHNLIVVTGFGPFAGHEKVNASWEAVKLLPDKFKGNEKLFYVEKILVPVVYDEVDHAVEHIWQKNPTLVVHCGVHGLAREICLEKFAYNNRFCKADYAGKKLDCSSANLKNKGSCEILCTLLDVEKIADSLNSSIVSDKSMFRCSKNVGDFLCGYIYLKSLDHNCSKCLFIHVPPVDKPFSSQETADAIFEVIKECLKCEITEKILETDIAT